jgi:hypothetical protein
MKNKAMTPKFTALLFGFGLSLSAQAAPLGVAPGSTGLSQAKVLLGEPKATPIPQARYQFAAPVGSGYSSVELYIGRKSQVVELAQYSFEPATDATALKTQLKQKESDLRYTLASGDTAEVFFAIKARIILNKEGKAKAVEYLSNESLRVLLLEVAPFTADRSTPAGAYRALSAALFSGKETELTASLGGAKSATGLEVSVLQKARPSLLVALEGATVTLPATKPKAKDAIIKINHPLFGALEFVFLPSDKGWLLSQLNGLSTPLEKTASTPRAALSLYLKSLYAKPITPAPKGATPPDITGIIYWGSAWYLEFEKLVLTTITLEGAKATILLPGSEKSAQVSCALEGKLWRVTEIKPLN